MTALTLLVLRCRDLELSREFYEALGLTFTPEQHGFGPVHDSTQLGGVVLELYPAKTQPSVIRIGIAVHDVASALRTIQRFHSASVRECEASAEHAVIRDPDGNTIELTQRSAS